jgi:hypothetical protein
MTVPHDRDDVESTHVTTVIEIAPQIPVATEIERRAVAWIAPYNQAMHLLRARDWLVYLDENASLEARLAALTRRHPGGGLAR